MPDIVWRVHEVSDRSYETDWIVFNYSQTNDPLLRCRYARLFPVLYVVEELCD